MVLFGFGDFDYVSTAPLPLSWERRSAGNEPQLTSFTLQLCRNVPSLPSCNLFFRQLLNHPKGLTAPASSLLGLPDSSNSTFASTLSAFGSAAVNPACIIPRMAAAGGADGNLGNVGNIAACGLSVLIAIGLAFAAGRRAAAVGRVEMRILFLLYALVKGAELVDTGGLLMAGSYALTWVSAVHVGLLVALFWCLAWIAMLSLQFVEDGTPAALIPMAIGMVVFFVGTGYIALDTGLTITNYFQSDPADKLKNIWLFVFTIIWPAAAAAFYFLVQLGVVVRVLKEKKPLGQSPARPLRPRHQAAPAMDSR